MIIDFIIKVFDEILKRVVRGYHLIKQPPLNFGIEPSPYVKEMVKS
jgi:hypothetical protein